MLKTIVRTAACLAVSAAAFTVLATLDATAGSRTRSPSVPETAAPKPPAPKPTEPPPKLALLPPQAARTPTSATRSDADRMLTVPDWKGKRLSIVRREARQLGLALLAYDETGDWIDGYESSSYRVRRQLTRAGTPVEPGATIEVRAREIAEAATGY